MLVSCDISIGYFMRQSEGNRSFQIRYTQRDQAWPGLSQALVLNRRLKSVEKLKLLRAHKLLHFSIRSGLVQIPRRQYATSLIRWPR